MVDLHPQHVGSLVDALGDLYYLDPDAVREAVRARSSFNLIHLETVLKLDVFVLKPRPFDQGAFGRGITDTLAGPGGISRNFRVESAEDVVLHKLDWYRLGNETSERQWLDVVGVLRVQAGATDTVYLQHWADKLGVRDLLDRALAQADTDE